ncbi:MAG TPA: acyl-CoA dehydrogenase, partial [Paenibacillaceae bacterium]|nr:acyl-CoA dehydrogenase [Paenibacillaceae bacterium]
FIVERGYPGVSVGPEEKKMGIKGSSTCPLNLDQVPVPVGNVLGEIGKGHQIAFNILNIGRYKLGIGTIGACKWAIEEAVVYANQRQQFQTPISRFPLIQKKIADMAIRTFISESLTYRTGAYLEESVNKIDLTGFAAKASAKAIEEHAMEYSIAKVFGSEALDFVADEGVQIHGGYGYIAEYPIEQIYRDSRINRIFEGTNEINRLLIPSTLFKRAMQGRLPLMAKLQSLQKELISFSNERPEGVLGEERRMVEAAKKIALFTGGTMVERFGPKLESQQELLENLSNLIITVYAMDSALLRARKNAEKIGEEAASHQINMVQVFIRDVWGQMEKWGKEILIGCHEGDELRTRLTILKKMLRADPVNTIQLKRKIAEEIIKEEKYNSL